MSTTAPSDIDRAVARYREQLSREADLGRARLDEIEDHLRLLIDDLQATGMPAAQAVTEAARRLGDPRAIARESARVRTPFGAKLPMWRALAVIAIFLPQIAWGPVTDTWMGLAERVIGGALCGAMLLRSAWARAVLFGIMGWSVVWTIVRLGAGLGEWGPPAWMIATQLAGLALLAPWRRADLTAPGWALALLYPMYCAGAWFMGWMVTDSLGLMPIPDAIYAVAGVLLAGVGLVLRARWAALPAIAAVAVMVMWFGFLAETRFRMENAAAVQAMSLVAAGACIVAGTAIAILAWRSARSTLGTLRGVLE